MTRRRIRQELGRDDVIRIINTHDHFDHTNGNQMRFTSGASRRPNRCRHLDRLLGMVAT